MATVTIKFDARKKVNTLFRVTRRKTGIEVALEDVRQGKVNTYKTVDDLLQKINS